MVPYLEAYPRIQAAIDGAVLGILGAAAFISLSYAGHYIAEARRRRRAFELCSQSNDRVLQELLTHPRPSAPGLESAVDRARFAFWNSRSVVSGALWAARSNEVRPKAN